MVKVLDFVQLGGPKWIVGSTIFELWQGSLESPLRLLPHDYDRRA